MELPDVISLSISIALGILSIGLGIYSIFLSMRFAEQSSVILANLRETAIEIRKLTVGVLSNQDNFSNKMLDSILDRNSYGTTISTGVETSVNDSVESIIEKRFKTVEERINAKVADLTKYAGEDIQNFKEVIQSIQSDVNSLVDTAKNVSVSRDLPVHLKKIMEDWVSYPALAILAEIILENDVKTSAEVKDLARGYNLPSGWEGGIDAFLENGLIRGNREAFTVADEYILPTKIWLAKNKSLIAKVKGLYQYDGSSTTPLEEAQKISSHFAF